MITPFSLDEINSILGDLSNFALVFFGFSISLFTLLYSFVFTRRDNLKEYSDEIKAGDESPVLNQRLVSARIFIAKMRRNIIHLLVTVLFEIGSYITSLWAKYAVRSLECKELWLIGCGVLNVAILLYVGVLLALVIWDFSRNTKI